MAVVVPTGLFIAFGRMPGRGEVRQTADAGSRPARRNVPRVAGQAYSGSIEPLTRVDVLFRQGGYVEEILNVKAGGQTRLVQEGDSVTKTRCWRSCGKATTR